MSAAESQKSALKEQRTQLEARLNEERESKAELEAELSALRTKHMTELNALQQQQSEGTRGLEQALREARDAHEREVLESEAKLKEDFSSTIAKMQDELNQAKADFEREREEQLAAKTVAIERFAEEMKELRNTAEKEREVVETEFRSRLQELEEEVERHREKASFLAKTETSLNLSLKQTQEMLRASEGCLEETKQELQKRIESLQKAGLEKEKEYSEGMRRLRDGMDSSQSEMREVYEENDRNKKELVVLRGLQGDLERKLAEKEGEIARLAEEMEREKRTFSTKMV